MRYWDEINRFEGLVPMINLVAETREKGTWQGIELIDNLNPSKSPSTVKNLRFTNGNLFEIPRLIGSYQGLGGFFVSKQIRKKAR